MINSSLNTLSRYIEHEINGLESIVGNNLSILKCASQKIDSVDIDFCVLKRVFDLLTVMHRIKSLFSRRPFKQVDQEEYINIDKIVKDSIDKMSMLKKLDEVEFAFEGYPEQKLFPAKQLVLEQWINITLLLISKFFSMRKVLVNFHERDSHLCFNFSLIDSDDVAHIDLKFLSRWAKKDNVKLLQESEHGVKVIRLQIGV